MSITNPATTPRFRQVHIDFHTPGDVEDIGIDFDPVEYAQTLADAHVDTVNVIAKCHHGYSYYPTDVGVMHPGLAFDLLGQQIQALHDQDIRATIYVSIQWDDLAGIQHPDWLIVDKSNQVRMRPPLTAPPTSWTTLDVASGYRDYLFAVVEELCQRYDVDGFWFDILWPEPNYAPWGQARAKSLGIDLADDAAMHQLATQDLIDFEQEMTELVLRHEPSASIYYNGSIYASAELYSPSMTHLEVESLPTSGTTWGYMHFPVVSRYVRTLGKPILGMTGKFHKSWADFGGIKPANQLEYECGTILSAGGRICIGDQLDPSGRLDPATYRAIGKAFERVLELEPWITAVTPTSEIGIIIDRRRSDDGLHATVEFTAAVNGAAQMLLDLHHQFDIVDPFQSSLSGYKVLIVPDGLVATQALQSLLAEARRNGAKIIVGANGGLDENGSYGDFTVPATVGEEIEIAPSFIKPGVASKRFPDLDPEYGYVFYGRVRAVEPTGTARALGEVWPARYERRWDHFFSHQHAPIGSTKLSPWAVVSDDTAVLGCPLFAGYTEEDYWVYKALLSSLLDIFLPAALLETNAPAWVEGTLHRPPTGGDSPFKAVVELVSYTPRRSQSSVPRIDEGAVLAGIYLDVDCPEQPEAMYLAPSREPLPFTWSEGRAHVKLPEVRTQTIVVAE